MSVGASLDRACKIVEDSLWFMLFPQARPEHCGGETPEAAGITVPAAPSFPPVKSTMQTHDVDAP